MRGAGFQVEARDVDQDRLMEVAMQAGVPAQLGSCHTAQVGGYIVEGHVPAEDVRRLLRERPQVIGIDTGAYKTGILTCLVLDGPERSFLQTA